MRKNLEKNSFIIYAANYTVKINLADYQDLNKTQNDIDIFQDANYCLAMKHLRCFQIF